MNSSLSMRERSRVVPKEFYDHLKPLGHLVLKSHPSAITSSFSSSSSSSFSSALPDESLALSVPLTPLHSSGVPFSWEKTPGIPKKFKDKDKDDDEDEDEDTADLQGRSLLPLPPLVTPPSSRRFSGHDDISLGKKVLFPADDGAWDPFVAALVECSKEEGYGNHGGKRNGDQENRSSMWICRRVSRRISDRFGVIALYGSCKRTSPTSESITCLPRSTHSSLIVTNRQSR